MDTELQIGGFTALISSLVQAGLRRIETSYPTRRRQDLNPLWKTSRSIKKIIGIRVTRHYLQLQVLFVEEPLSDCMSEFVRGQNRKYSPLGVIPYRDHPRQRSTHRTGAAATDWISCPPIEHSLLIPLISRNKTEMVRATLTQASLLLHWNPFHLPPMPPVSPYGLPIPLFATVQ